jgi:copper(I)-binding protein
MHASTEAGGVSRMRPLTTVALTPGEPYVFAPGGAHFMLIGLRSPLSPDSGFPMTLHFRDAGDITVAVTVTIPGAGPPSE